MVVLTPIERETLQVFFITYFTDGKNKSNENFKTAIPSNNYDRPKTTGECGMF